MGFADSTRSTTGTCIGEVNIWLKVLDPTLDETKLVGSVIGGLCHGTTFILGRCVFYVLCTSKSAVDN